MDHNQSENVAACSSPDTSDLLASAYRNGHLTFSGVMMTPEGCPKNFENWFGDRTPQFHTWRKAVQNRWKESGYPSLGDWPPQGTGLNLFDYSLGVMCGVLLSTTKLRHSRRKINDYEYEKRPT